MQVHLPNTKQAKVLRPLTQRSELSNDQHTPAEDSRRSDASKRSSEDQNVHVWRDTADERSQLEHEDRKHHDNFRREDLSPLRIEQSEAEESEEETRGEPGKLIKGVELSGLSISYWCCLSRAVGAYDFGNGSRDDELIYLISEKSQEE
jgi:hypothetical protein